MTPNQKTALVDAHWAYIERLLRAYNEHIGCHPEANLRVVEADYKEAMLAGLDGLDCPPCRRYPASRFMAYNIATAHAHGLNHTEQDR